jgi:hypothetical protein
MKRKRKRQEKKKRQQKKRKIELGLKKTELIKLLTDKEGKQYQKYKTSIFSTKQIEFLFGERPKHLKLIKKFLKTYITDIVVKEIKKKQ